MLDLHFFDAHCYVGRYKTFRAGSFYKTEDLLEQMTYFGIEEALVTHSLSREHHPIDGNAAIIGRSRTGRTCIAAGRRFASTVEPNC